jgi:hypothetical protein
VSLSKLASGRWGAQVHDPATGRNVRVSKILGDAYVTSAGAIGSRSFRTKSEAKAAREDARARLSAPRGGLTIAEWATRWTTDPLFARPKRSTDLHNAERIKEFVARYGDVPLTAMATEPGDAIVAEWLAGGRRNSTVGALRVFFNDAMSAKAGRLLARNPFAGLGIAKTKGNKDKAPPSLEQMETLLRHARELTPPSFAAYLEFGCVSGDLSSPTRAHPAWSRTSPRLPTRRLNRRTRCSRPCPSSSRLRCWRPTVDIARECSRTERVRQTGWCPRRGTTRVVSDR